MERYRNATGTSGVYAYEINHYNIHVQFVGNNRIYTYSYGRAGSNHVENMKRLALQGSGLNTYINNNVKFLYDL